MNFTAPVFLLFFPLVALAYRLLPPRMRWALLLAASYCFYAQGSWRALPLLLGTTALAYLCALKIGADAARKRAWLTLALCGCLGCLVLFKYLGFIDQNVRAALHFWGIDAGWRLPALPLPAGISFYTFQTLSYVLDVYRGKIVPERHFGYFALFVSFFPQLVAGPIERPENLLPQLHASPNPGADDLWQGLQWMLRGYFKKLVLADALARFVEPVYAAPGTAPAPVILAATVFFALQIYCDFSGYSDIASGTARMLGIHLTENFRTPYLAANIRDFWRRWHISLTSWFTEYLYIPLGGSRRGLWRHCRNIMLVFLISGAWHGANWTFFAWGGLHGLYLTADMLLRRRIRRTPTAHRLPAGIRLWGGRAVTFALVCLAWVFFRAASMADAFALLAGLFTRWCLPGPGIFSAWMGFALPDALQLVLGLCCLALLRYLPLSLSQADGKNSVVAAAQAVFFVLCAVLLGGLGLLSVHANSAFLYFQF